MQSLVVVTGEAEIIPVKPDAGNAAVGMSRILSFVRTLLCTFLMIFNCNIRTMDSKYIPTLTIAGSDSCGGAGLQADIKTMSALGCYACSVVTAVTAQDTLRVHQVMDVPVAMVVSQLHAVLADISPVAIKTGMIGNAEIAAAVAVELETAPRVPLVVDPVMVATSGDPLMRAGTLYIVTGRLLPLATIVTPNIPEAEAMADMKIVSDDDVWTAAARILAFGCKAVVMPKEQRKPTACSPPTAPVTNTVLPLSTPQIPTVPAVLCRRPSPPSWPVVAGWRRLSARPRNISKRPSMPVRRWL